MAGDRVRYRARVQPPSRWRGPMFGAAKELFLLALGRRLKDRAPGRLRAIRRQIRQEAAALCNHNRWRFPDPWLDPLVGLACHVLAAYRAVLPVAGGKEEAIDLTQRAFEDVGAHRVRAILFLGFGVSPLAPHRAFDEIVANFKPRVDRTFYGAHFVAEEALSNGDRYDFHVRRCLFHDLFAAHGVPELTRVFCDWDEPWGAELNRSRYGVVYERPSTIGRGGDMCRFQFRRAGAGEAPLGRPGDRG